MRPLIALVTPRPAHFLNEIVCFCEKIAPAVALITYVEKGSPLARLAIREVWPIRYVIGWFAEALTRCSEHYGLKSMTTEVDVNDSPV